MLELAIMDSKAIAGSGQTTAHVHAGLPEVFLRMLVMGGTDRVSAAVARSLIERGVTARVLMRHATPLASLPCRGASTLQGVACTSARMARSQRSARGDVMTK